MKFIILALTILTMSCIERNDIRHNNYENMQDPVLIIFQEFYGEEVEISKANKTFINEKIFYNRNDTTGISKEIYIEKSDLAKYTITVKGFEFYFEKPVPKDTVAISISKISAQIKSKSDISIIFHNKPLEIA